MPLLKIVISAIVLTLLVGCSKYESPGQKYLREMREDTAKEAVEREKRYARRAKEEKFNFYGIHINSLEYDYKFVSKGGSFSWYPSKMNKDIYARIDKVAPSDNHFIVMVHNDSDKPFSTNYFSDKFSIVTKDNREYVLDNDNLGSYPEYPPETSGYINPNDNMGVKLSLPSGVGISTIKKFIVNIGWDVRIVLKPDLKTTK